MTSAIVSGGDKARSY